MNEQQRIKNKLLNENESKQLLEKAGIPVVDTRLARSKKEAVDLSGEIGYPVVLKIVSPDINHKSDVGGVKVGLTSSAQVSRAYDEIVESARRHIPDVKIDGVSVQKMERPGVEIIIGMSEDAQFGPVIMFGLGGICVEVLKDVSFRIVPINAWDAAEMIREIKGHAVLEGYRGQEPVDISYLEALLLKVSGFIEKNPKIKELDINPLIAYSDGAIAVDARIVIKS